MVLVKTTQQIVIRGDYALTGGALAQYALYALGMYTT